MKRIIIIEVEECRTTTGGTCPYLYICTERELCVCTAQGHKTLRYSDEAMSDDISVAMNRLFQTCPLVPKAQKEGEQ